MSTASAAGTQACDYERLENGIHFFRFNKASREALDQHFEKLGALLASTPATVTVRVLLDFRPAGFPPIAYAFQKVRAMNMRIPQRPRQRLAFLHHPNALTHVVQSFIQLQRLKDPVHFFPAEQYDAAIAWLLEGSL